MNDEEQAEAVVEAPAPPGAPEEEAAEAEFAFVTLPPEIDFATRQVQPPAHCYISRTDLLELAAWNVVTGGTIHLSVRILRADGQMIHCRWDYVPTADGAPNFWVLGLAEGFLLALTVHSGDFPGASCYVRVRLASQGAYPETVVSGYLRRFAALCWPYPRYEAPCEGAGRLRIITGTDPAPGAQITEVVPTGVRWKLLALTATLTTSEGAYNRDVMLCFADSSWVGWQGNAQTSQPANTGYTYTWLINADARLGSLAYRVQDRLPDQITLAAGWRFYTGVSGMYGNDDWAAPVYYVEEWVEP